jgi:hypothetical protein
MTPREQAEDLLLRLTGEHARNLSKIESALLEAERRGAQRALREAQEQTENQGLRACQVRASSDAPPSTPSEAAKVIAGWRETADIWERHLKRGEVPGGAKRRGMEAPERGRGAVANWINWLRKCAVEMESALRRDEASR